MKKKLYLIITLCLALLVSSILLFNLLKQNPYKQYEQERFKKIGVGEVKHINKNSEQSYTSIFYPDLKNKILDKAIKHYVDNEMVLKGKQKYIHYTDYEIQQPFSNYMNITFHQFIYNEKGEKLIEQIHIINYDKKANKILSLEDVFRKDYQNMIATILRKENKAYTTDSISQFKIDKDGITLYFNNEIEQFVHLIYSQIPSYIKLKDEHIASLFQIQPQPTVDELVDPNKAMVAFTFDDGPSESYTKAIMDAFDKVDGKATFFMLGSQASKYGNIVKEVDKRGFEIANHTYNHKNLQALSDEEAYQEIMSTQDILYSYTGKESRFLRSPYGNNPKLDLSDTNIKTVLWNLDTLDWKSRNSEAIKNNIRKNIHDGSIILLHDIYPASAKAIKEILPELKKQGYQFVSMTTLMKYRNL